MKDLILLDSACPMQVKPRWLTLLSQIGYSISIVWLLPVYGWFHNSTLMMLPLMINSQNLISWIVAALSFTELFITMFSFFVSCVHPALQRKAVCVLLYVKIMHPNLLSMTAVAQLQICMIAVTNAGWSSLFSTCVLIGCSSYGSLRLLLSLWLYNLGTLLLLLLVVAVVTLIRLWCITF